MKYIAPARNLKAYSCPHCGVIARQYCHSVLEHSLVHGSGHHHDSHAIASTVCEHCREFSLWVETRMVYPNRGNAPVANEDMPDDVKVDYEEAASIATLSPKAASALLRLAIQKLCIHLGEPGKNINDDIGGLVKKGLPEIVQRSLDIVRVVGNNAVHPGQIDIDDQNVVNNLFGLINLIVESMISTPKKVAELYSALPKTSLAGIAKRDSE